MDSEFIVTYVGSFEVSPEKQQECRLKKFAYVREQLDFLRCHTVRPDFLVNCKRVVLEITDMGVKMSSLDNKIVHMSHALKRVSYATCDPDYFLFAFVAREPTSLKMTSSSSSVDGATCHQIRMKHKCDGLCHDTTADSGYCTYTGRHREYCHVYRAENLDEVEKMNQQIGEAFRIAYEQNSKTKNQYNVRNSNRKPTLDSNGNSSISSQEDSEKLIFQSQQSASISSAYSLSSRIGHSKNYENNENMKNDGSSLPTLDSPFRGDESLSQQSSSKVTIDSLPDLSIGHEDLTSKRIPSTEFSNRPVVPIPAIRMRNKCRLIQSISSASEHNFTASPNIINGETSLTSNGDNNSINIAPPPKMGMFKKRRPSSSIFVPKQRAKNLYFHDVIVKMNDGDLIEESRSRMELLSGDQVEILAKNQKRLSHRLSATFGSAFFKKIFTSSTWRLSPTETEENSSIKNTNLDKKPNHRKRRPLSAIFLQNSSIKNADKPCPIEEFRFSKKYDDCEKLSNGDKLNFLDNSSEKGAKIGEINRRRSRFMNLADCSNETDNASCSNKLTSAEWAELSQAAWFVGDKITKEFLSEILENEQPGSFVVRKSTSQNGSLALSMKVPTDNLKRIDESVVHFLIVRSEKGFKIKGFSKHFPSVQALITHHSIMREQLPYRLVFRTIEEHQKPTVIQHRHTVDFDFPLGKVDAATMTNFDDVVMYQSR